MGDRNIYFNGFQNLEVPRRLRPQKKPATLAIDKDAVTQGPPGNKKREEIVPKVKPSASPNRPREGFLLGPWVAEQELLSRDSETSANTKRQHALFTEHLLLSMMCTEELELPKKKEDAGTKPRESQIADVPTMDQVSAGLPKGGQLASKRYIGHNRGGGLKGSDSTQGKD